MQNLKTVLEKMLAAKVRCTLSTLNSYLGKEYDWAAVSDCGASETAQAHLTMSDGETTNRWRAQKFSAIRIVVAKAKLVRSSGELRSALEG